MGKNRLVEQEFSIGEVAKFFEVSIPWLRREERLGHLRWKSGSLIEPQRTEPRTAAVGQRRYTVREIRAMAESLRKLDRIDQVEYERVIKRVEAFSE